MSRPWESLRWPSSDDTSLSVSCPTCGSLSGEPCTRARGERGPVAAYHGLGGGSAVYRAGDLARLGERHPHPARRAAARETA